MERKVTAVYTAFSLLVFVFLASWLAFTFFQTRSNNLIDTANTFEDISNSTAISLNSAGRFDGPHFRAFIRSLFMQIPSIDVLTISAPTGGVQYVYARKRSDLISPRVANDRWSGSIRYSRLTQNMFSRPLRLTSSSGAPFHIRAVFTILSRSDLYSIARMLLIFLLSFVILTLIVILIAPVPVAESGRGTGQPAGSNPPDRDPSDGRNPREGKRRRRSEQPPSPAAPERSGEKPARDENRVIALGPPPHEQTPSRTETGPPEDAAPPTPSAPARSGRRGEYDDTSKKRDANRGDAPFDLPASEGQETAPEARQRAEEDGRDSHSEARGARPPAERLEESHEAEETGDTEAPAGTPAARDDALPPDVRLPSLHEVAADPEGSEAGSTEISLYDQLTEQGAEEMIPLDDEDLQGPPAAGSPSFEVTAVEEHAEPPASPTEPSSDYHPADDELADIEDFEDLERIDGAPGEPVEEHPRPRRPPAPPSPAPLPPSDEPEDPPAQATEEPARIAGSTPQEPAPEPDSPPQEPLVSLPALDEPPPSPAEQPAVSEVEELLPFEAEDRLPDVGEPDPTEALPLPGEGEEVVESAGGQGDDAVERPLPSAVGGRHVRDLFNPESGLAWRDHLEQRLSFELGRAASFDQDLSISIVRFAQPAEDVERVNYAREIRTYFPFHDLCFEYGTDAFAIVLPNTDVDQAIRSMENFNNKMHEDRPGAPKMLFGLSARNGRLLGSDRLLTEAETALEKAREDGRNSIFALRVDPGKYREFIKSTLK